MQWHVIGQYRQVVAIQCHILLKAAILMMQMVGRPQTVLFRARQTILATPAHATPKADTNNLPGMEIVLAIRT